jgi:hypothetical protein
MKILKNFKKEIYFGEDNKDYEVRVLNEREVRAGSGILLFFAAISFANAWFIGNFFYLKIFVTIFLLDFFIRVLINPKYSPSLILGRLAVSNQTPEYTGAPQKRFAWAIGLFLAIIMFFILNIFNSFGPINLIICVLCLVFLFFETAFGICLGCLFYQHILKKETKLCPGGACEIKRKHEIQKVNKIQLIVLIIFIGLITILVFSNFGKGKNYSKKNCEFPDYVKKLNHQDIYRIHHNCK